jgi:hypothetical protein
MKLDEREWLAVGAAVLGALIGTLIGALFFLFVGV